MRKRPVLLAAVLVAAFAAAASAVSTCLWESTRQEDWIRGKLEGTVVTSRGEIRVGEALDRIEYEDATAIWSALLARDGSLYLGTGNARARILRRVGEAFEVVCETDEVAITCLAESPDGTLYAGTMPGGWILRARGGKLEGLQLRETGYVWALAFGEPGALYAATGPHGELLRVDLAGKVEFKELPKTAPKAEDAPPEEVPGEGGEAAPADDAPPAPPVPVAPVAPEAPGEPAPLPGGVEVWYKAKQPNLLCLAAEPGGAFLVGTDGKAYLYRVTGRDKALVLYDFEAAEVRALARAGGAIYAAVNVGAGAAPPQVPEPVVVMPGGMEGGGAAAMQAMAAAMAAGGGACAVGAGGGGQCAVWRLHPDGRSERVMDLAETFIADIAVDADGNVLAATGDAGRVWSASVDGEARTLLFDADEAQVLRLVLREGHPAFLAAANPAALLTVRPVGEDGALYTSPPLDARFPARWGRLTWKAEGKVAFETRVGHTAEPDDETWDAWVALEDVRPAPGAMHAGRVASRRARYVQYRVRFLERTAALHDASVAYRVANQKPRLADLAVRLPGADGMQPGGEEMMHGEGGAVTVAPAQNPAAMMAMAMAGAEGQPAPGALPRTIAWMAADPDGDPLFAEVFFRGEDEPNWRSLTEKTGPVPGPELPWDTSGLPDGRYLVRVAVSDERANAPGEGFTVEKVSDPVLVDNSQPAVKGLAVRRVELARSVEGLAIDAFSRIVSVEVAVDGGEWRAAGAVDGLFDSNEERFNAPLPGALEKGKHAVAARVTDAAGGRAAVRIVFEVK